MTDAADPVVPSTRRGGAEERGAARRRRLLDAGLEVFGTEGYAASTIPDLCLRAGVGTTSFYAEFATKEELLLAVYEEVIARAGEALLGGVQAQPAGDLPTAVTRAVRAFVTAATADERAARVQLIEVVGVSPAVEARRREVLGDFARTVSAATRSFAQAGLVEREVDVLTGLALVGAANELLVEWALSRTHLRPAIDELVATLSALTLGALREAAR